MKVRESQIPEESSKAVKVEENSNNLIPPNKKCNDIL